jgi:hypothetical protein
MPARTGHCFYGAKRNQSAAEEVGCKWSHDDQYLGRTSRAFLIKESFCSPDTPLRQHHHHHHQWALPDGRWDLCWSNVDVNIK